jgi:hypothetical protein
MAYNENCLFLEANTGDGGVHDATTAWWLSPDVDIIAPTAGQGTGPRAAGDPPVDNTIQVRLHKKLTGCTGFSSNQVFVDVFVGDPSLAMSRSTNTKKVVQPGRIAGDPTEVVAATDLSGGNKTINVTWRLAFASSGIEAPGHKCLVAQIYQADDTAPDTFGLATEQHTAQHNITICRCASPCGQLIQTTAPGRKAETVTIRAFVDLKPTARVVRITRSLIKAARITGFRRIRTAAPPHFKFEFPERLRAKTRDYKAPYSKSRQESSQPPKCTATVKLQPGRSIKFRLLTDLEFAEFGDAFIFHVIQTGENRRPQGGLTVVFIRLKPGK